MYLAHIPVQFQILLLVGEETWPASLKFGVYVFGTIAVLWPSYHFLVRPTWIGWLLNGRMVQIRAEHDALPSSLESRPTTTTAGVEANAATVS